MKLSGKVVINMDKKQLKAIGKRVERVRVKKLGGMSQVQLGKALGTTGQNIGHLINGYNAVSLDLAIKLCEYANVSMDYIFRGISDNNYINVHAVVKAVEKFNKRNRWFIFTNFYI